MDTMLFEIILYVADQQRSRDFYAYVLGTQPNLDVPGMTEFNLTSELKLGLMPENGIAKIISGNMPHPHTAHGIPRCELYIVTKNITAMYERAIDAGGKEVSKIADRDWGDTVGYIADIDGHIIAIAKRS